MLWIREPFLSSLADHGAVIVHGHTPKREPVVRPNRIAIDTGAVLGGALTCVVLEERQTGVSAKLTKKQHHPLLLFAVAREDGLHHCDSPLRQAE